MDQPMGQRSMGIVWGRRPTVVLLSNHERNAGRGEWSHVSFRCLGWNFHWPSLIFLFSFFSPPFIFIVREVNTYLIHTTANRNSVLYVSKYGNISQFLNRQMLLTTTEPFSRISQIFMTGNDRDLTRTYHHESSLVWTHAWSWYCWVSSEISLHNHQHNIIVLLP